MAKEIEEIEAKIKVYKEELERTKNELAELRTQKSAEAKKTLTDYESSISKLENIIADKKIQIKALDDLIDSKREKANKEEDSAAKKYYALEADLMQKQSQNEADYHAKLSELNKRSQELESRSLEQTAKENRLSALKDSLAQKQADIENRASILADDLNLFDKQKEKFNSNVEIKEKLLKQMISDVESQKADLDKREESLKISQKNADDVIASISEANKILAEANAKEKANAEKTAQLNELNVSLQVERKRLNKRAEELDEKDQKLKVRENNLKELEAKV